MTGQNPFYLRQWRDHRGLTQQQLADRVGISKPHVSELERGKKQYTQKMLELLADALNCDPADLLVRDPSQPQPIWSIWDRIPETKRSDAIRVLQAFTGDEKKVG